jgi:hypothetical protein
LSAWTTTASYWPTTAGSIICWKQKINNIRVVLLYNNLVTTLITVTTWHFAWSDDTNKANNYNFIIQIFLVFFSISNIQRIRVLVFNTTFNNISVISWLSVLLMEENGVPRENHRPIASHWQILSHNVVSCTPHHEWDSNSQLSWW